MADPKDNSTSSDGSGPNTPVQLPRTSSVSSINSLDSDQSSSNSSSSGYYVPLERLTMLDLLDSLSSGTVTTKKLVRRKGDELKSLALRQREKYESDIEHLRESVLRKVQRLEDKLSSTEIISTGEKLTFSFGVLNILYAGFIIGRWPEYFHLFYTIELMVLLPIRFYTYKRKQYHYFLADLCYFVNFLNMIYIWLWPESVQLFISCYALSFGTLSWAVITWRNSLVLHSIDKTTSSFIHILPPTVFHVITHQLDPELKAARFAGAERFDQWHTITGILWASLAYLVWQSLYHYFITLKRQAKIKAGYATSFEYLRKSYSNTPLGKFVNGLPEPFPVVAFTLIQYSYQLCTMSLCPIWYSHSWLSALFVTFIFFWASYNGATYYIDIFGKRFQKQLLELQAEVAEWKDLDESKDTKEVKTDIDTKDTEDKKDR